MHEQKTVETSSVDIHHSYCTPGLKKKEIQYALQNRKRELHIIIMLVGTTKSKITCLSQFKKDPNKRSS